MPVNNVNTKNDETDDVTKRNLPPNLSTNRLGKKPMKPFKSRLKQLCTTMWNARLSAVYKVGLRGEAEEFLTLYKARTDVFSRSAQYTIASFFMYCRMQNYYCVRVNQLNRTGLKFLVVTSTNCLEREWTFLWGGFSKHIFYRKLRYCVSPKMNAESLIPK